jgi:hypothetical protein
MLCFGSETEDTYEQSSSIARIFGDDILFVADARSQGVTIVSNLGRNKIIVEEACIYDFRVFHDTVVTLLKTVDGVKINRYYKDGKSLDKNIYKYNKGSYSEAYLISSFEILIIDSMYLQLINVLTAQQIYRHRHEIVVKLSNYTIDASKKRIWALAETTGCSECVVSIDIDSISLIKANSLFKENNMSIYSSIFVYNDYLYVINNGSGNRNCSLFRVNVWENGRNDVFVGDICGHICDVEYGHVLVLNNENGFNIVEFP